MFWIKKLFGLAQPGLTVEVRVESTDHSYEPGQVVRGKVYRPGASPEEQRQETERLRITGFPPEDFKEPPPAVGLQATVWQFPIKRAAEISRHENGGRIYARVEFSTKERCFSKRQDGTWRELHLRGNEAPRLVLGIRESNLALFKRWWSQRELAVGPLDAPKGSH